MIGCCDFARQQLSSWFLQRAYYISYFGLDHETRLCRTQVFEESTLHQPSRFEKVFKCQGMVPSASSISSSHCPLMLPLSVRSEQFIMRATAIFAIAFFLGTSVAIPLQRHDTEAASVNGRAYLSSPASSLTTAVDHRTDVTMASPADGKAAVAAYIKANGNSSTLATGAIASTDPRFPMISVYHHNVHRLNHSAGQVSWNKTMASLAQSWADTCTTAEVIPSGSSFGMNTAYSQSPFNPSQAISDLWYNDEIQNYPAYGVANLDVGPGSNFGSWGHFSQLVWSTTTQIGCGINTKCSGSFPIYFGCYYQPAGNILGQFNKVNPPDGAPTVRANGD